MPQIVRRLSSLVFAIWAVLASACSEEKPKPGPETPPVKLYPQFDRRFTVIGYHDAYGPRMGDKPVIPDFLRFYLDE